MSANRRLTHFWNIPPGLSTSLYVMPLLRKAYTSTEDQGLHPRQLPTEMQYDCLGEKWRDRLECLKRWHGSALLNGSWT